MDGLNVWFQSRQSRLILHCQVRKDRILVRHPLLGQSLR
jgi:hypothetical protein